jgi:hypothetical protein
MKNLFEKLNKSTSETKRFIFTLVLLGVVVIGAVIFAFARLF